MVSSRDVLGSGSPLSKSFPGFEDRPAQLAMAEAIEDALTAEQPLFVEAGTGTGKTLAYLVPAILSGKKVVISTATRALQDQIWEKDLPLVARALEAHGVTFHAALMKGLSNYLCKRRLAELVDVTLDGTSGAARASERGRVLYRIDRWSKETRTGDRAELADVAEDAAAWREVQSSTETRIGAGCPHFEACFVTRMRREAEEARIVVVNHHLFFADLALRRGRGGDYASAIPNYDAVVFDEAHTIEDIATDFFGVRVSTARVDALVRDAARSFLAAKVGGGRSTTSTSTTTTTSSAPSNTRALERTSEAAHAFFDTMAQAGRVGGGETRRTLAASDFASDVLAAYAKLDQCLELVAATAAEHDRHEAVAIIGRRANDLRADLRAIIKGASADADPEAKRVAWLSSSDRALSIGASPIELGDILRRALFERVPSVVCTSATLATAGAGRAPSFHFAKARLGAPPETRELVAPSPFNFPERAVLYLPRDLPEPGDPAFEDAAAKRIEELVRITGGGAFVLCTSTRAMRRLHAILARRLDAPTLVQGEAPKHMLLDRFRTHEDAVLVATMSFWEGVDVPGRALRLVIIDKIPFAVPSDPIVAARGQKLELEGGNAFAEYSVPTAAITLKQGFGRLLRSQKDAGIVAILDRRISTRGYGKALVASLPPATRVAELDDVRSFWRGIASSLEREQHTAPALGVPHGAHGATRNTPFSSEG